MVRVDTKSLYIQSMALEITKDLETSSNLKKIEKGQKHNKQNVEQLMVNNLKQYGVPTMNNIKKKGLISAIMQRKATKGAEKT